MLFIDKIDVSCVNHDAEPVFVVVYFIFSLNEFESSLLGVLIFGFRCLG